jgi:hypothetical protein
MAAETHPMDAVRHALGGSDSKPPKEIREIRTRKGKSGGYIHEHHHTHPEHHPMEEHTSGDQDAMAEHMLSNMGAPNPGEAEADAGTPDAASPAGPTGSGTPTPGAGSAAVEA